MLNTIINTFQETFLVRYKLFILISRKQIAFYEKELIFRQKNSIKMNYFPVPDSCKEEQIIL